MSSSGGSPACCTTSTTSATPDLDTGHPRIAMAELRARGYPEELIRAVGSHADFLGISRDTPMEKTLFAVDELSGFVLAVAYVRPEGLDGMTPKSVKKKMKQPSFAAAVSRDDLLAGAEALGRRVRRARRDRDRGAGGRSRRSCCPAAVTALPHVRGARVGYRQADVRRNQDRRVGRRRDRAGAARAVAARARLGAARVRDRARALRPLAREPPRHQERRRARGRRGDARAPASASRRRRSRPRARTTSARPTRSCARASAAR